jgi:hypothetical protein
MYPVFQFNNPRKIIFSFLKVPFKDKVIGIAYFNKNEDLRNIYEKETKKWTLYALKKSINLKGIHFCRLENEKLEYIEVNEEINSSKIVTKNNNNNFVILYNFEENACCIAYMFDNNFEIVIY